MKQMPLLFSPCKRFFPFYAILLLIAVLSLGSCSNEQHETNSGNNSPDSYTLRLLTAYNTFETEPLVVQISEAPTAFIWQFSEKMTVPNPDSASDSINATPSTLANLESRAKDYKLSQDHLKKAAPVILSGDDRTRCDSIFNAIASAKRAGITLFYFETNYRPSSRTGSFVSWEGDIDHLIRPAEISGKPITITISADNLFYWENEMISLEDYVHRLREIAIRDDFETSPENHSVHFIVRVDAETNYAALRYVADQIKRINIKSITLELQPKRQS